MIEYIEIIIDKILKTIYLHIFIYFRFIYFSQNWGCKMPKRPSGMEANFWDISSWNQWKGFGEFGNDVPMWLWKARKPGM